MFSLQKNTPLGRRGQLQTAHGLIETPFFMPVGTAGAMKGLTHGLLQDLGAQILLCNTYHLHIHPGEALVQKAGGLHQFISWQQPILTDSGGYQVYSLRDSNAVDDSGVWFRSHRDGTRLFLGPNEAMQIQLALGADIIMCFDECPPSTASRPVIERAVDRTLRWAKICRDIHQKHCQSISDPLKKPQLFGIVQGGLHDDLRKKCAEELLAIGFDGYAIGGLAVGETEENMYAVLDAVLPLLPEDQPRYLMGVGVLHQMKACIAKGIDMFDCVLPMRIARHGKLLLSDGEQLNIKRAEYKDDISAIDPQSPSLLGQQHSKSYLHHLFAINERNAEIIATAQNMGVTLNMMQNLRGQMNES